MSVTSTTAVQSSSSWTAWLKWMFVSIAFIAFVCPLLWLTFDYSPRPKLFLNATASLFLQFGRLAVATGVRSGSHPPTAEDAINNQTKHSERYTTTVQAKNGPDNKRYLTNVEKYADIAQMFVNNSNYSNAIVTIDPQGRLGNQMFEYAALLGIAYATHKRPVISGKSWKITTSFRNLRYFAIILCN